MKKLSMAIVMCAAVGMGQTAMKSVTPDWTPCTDVTDKWKPEVKAFNDAHSTDGLQIEAACMFHDASPSVPDKTYPLTNSEAARLRVLRAASAKASDARAAYEKKVIAAHGIHVADFSDPCWRYVGIKMDDNFISEAQKSAFPCEPVMPAPKPTLGDEAQGYQVVKPMEVDPPPASEGHWNLGDWKVIPQPAVVLDSTGHMAVSDSFAGPVMVPSKTGRIDRLSDEEYARLQGTPMKDYEAEKRKVALAHGVVGVSYDDPPCSTLSITCSVFLVRLPPSDLWEIRGQWLLVNVPQGVWR